MAELAFVLDAHVGAVAAVEIGEREAAVVLLDAAVRPAHVHVRGEVQIPAFAPELQHVGASADSHAVGAALEDLGDPEGARRLGGAVEHGALAVGRLVERGRPVEAEGLLTGEERVSGVDVDGAADADEDAVERALVADDELAVAVEQVRVFGGHERIFGELDVAAPPDDVLLHLQVIGEPVHAFAADEDHPGFGWVLHVAEEHGASRHDVRRDFGAAATTEFVTGRDGREALPAEIMSGLVHELFLSEVSVGRGSSPGRVRRPPRHRGG